MLTKYCDSPKDYSGSFNNRGSAGWIHTIKPQTKAQRFSQFSLELVQLGDKVGIHSTERDVAFLKVKRHHYSFALQAFRENVFSFIVVGKHLAFAIVR